MSLSRSIIKEMDPMPNISESDIPQVNVSPPVPVKHSNPLLKILIGLVLLGVGVGIGLFLGNNKNNISLSPKQTISTYDDCLDAKGSTVQESYPATCVTSDGTRFTQPLTDEEKQNLQPPDFTFSWKTYVDSSGKFTFKYPKDLILKDQNSEPDTSEYTQLFRLFNTFMDTNAPSFVVRARSGFTAQQLEKEDFDDMAGHVDYKIIKREGIKLSGKPTIKIIVFVGPEEEYKEDSGSVYIYSDIDSQESLSIRQLGADRAKFDQILSTFKFLDN